MTALSRIEAPELKPEAVRAEILAGSDIFLDFAAQVDAELAKMGIGELEKASPAVEKRLT